MLSTLRFWVVAFAAAAFVAGQTDCEETCLPQQIAATKCETTACVCYAYDDPGYVSCLQTECGRGYSSIREIQVVTCSYFGVELSPDPPGGSQPSPTQSTSNSESSSGTGTGSNGGGSSGSSSDTNSGSNSSPSVQPTKNGLSTGELIGIIIGSVSAVATIAGSWAAIRWRNKRGRDGSVLPSTVYHPLPTPAVNVHNIHNVHRPHVGPTYYGNGPPGYQPPPPYQAIHVVRK